ncbi:MAG: hypothetical protein PHR92_08045 [Lachnospiraceae bacterium]|nr:hypothetical protein [Lachnospiraceae bacterium]
MKKRNLILCGLLSMSMAAGSVFPVMATGNGAESQEAADAKTAEKAKEKATEFVQTVTGTTVKTKSGDETESNSESESSVDVQAQDGGTPPQMPDAAAQGEDQSAPDGAPGGAGQPPAGAPGGQSQGVDSYTAVNEFTEDITLDGDALESTGTDENAVLVSGADVNAVLNNVTVSRTSSDSTGGDNSSFYGVGAALLATAGNLYVHGATIDTDASGAAGVFAYGDSTVYVSDSTINTKQDTSGGIHAAGGGTLYAWDLTVSTDGESAAAIRSDRGGGTMVVDGGSYTSNGIGSPAVYCTADISINNADLTAGGSEAVCIEGLNTTRLYDCNLTGNMTDQDQNDCTWNVIVYQSMSGDSEVGNGTFQMVGGTLTAVNGGQFYSTNTECTIILEGVNIIPAAENDFFLRCTGNNNARGWGSAGDNASDCLFTAINQVMEGDVIWDSISNLDFYMTDGSTLTGAFRQDETYAGGSGTGYCNVYVDENSTWTVTGDSTVTALCQAGSIVDPDGQTVSIVGFNGTVYVDGDSDYTITADTYTASADTSNASVASEWAEHQAEKPV